MLNPHIHGRRPSAGRRRILAAGLALAAASAGAQVPRLHRGNVTMVLPFGPGGSVDSIARALGMGMAEAIGVPVVMDNRPGASGAIGASAAARAPADGSTLFLGSSTTQAVLPNVRAKLPFDPVGDFTPISLVAEVENALAVHPSVPVRTLDELVAYCKARPGQLSYGSFGTGSITHLAAELLKLAARIDLVHVPFKSATDQDVALMNAELQCAFVTLAASMPHIRSGRLRALAVSSSQRSPFLPQVPTTAEAGYPAVLAVSWGALYAPRRLEPALVAHFNAAVRTALAHPRVLERFQAINARAVPSTPEELAAYQARDFARWANVVRAAGIPVEGGS